MTGFVYSYTTPSPTRRDTYATSPYTLSTLSYNTAWPTALCNVPLGGKEGTIDAPAFQPTNMPCSTNKRWMIRVPEGNYVELSFEIIDLGPRACFLDTYLIVRDDHSKSSNNVLGIYCERANNPQNISSSGNMMSVEIVRSWRWTGSVTQDSPGLKARYRAKRLSIGGLYILFLRNMKRNGVSYFPYNLTIICNAMDTPLMA